MTLLTDDKRRLLAAKLLRRGIDATHLERRRERTRAAVRRDRPRLSFAQQRLWVLDRLEPGHPFYNISGIAELDGPLDVATLARAFAEIARRHESLRTTFAERDGVPWQVVAPPPDPAGWPLPVVDLEGLEAVRREAERLAVAEARTPMDLGRGPLVRTTLVRLGPALHLLLVTLHHIISDGWSNNIFLREMAELYEAFAAGRPAPLPELPLQYADFAEQQLEEVRGERLEREIAWWRQQLAGAPTVLEIPADRPRPPVQTFRGARLALHVSPEPTRALHRLAREEGATLFMVLLTAFGVLLRSSTGEEDLLVGSPVANRRRPEIEGLIGFFTNTLVLRLDLSGDPTFREALGRVREMAHGAYAHQDLPFEKLVEELQPERDLSRSPLFQVLAVLQNAPPARIELHRLALRRPELDPGIAKFDLMLDLTELEEPEGLLRGAFEHNTDLFDRATIERLAERFERLLQTVTAAPGRRLSELPLLAEAERRLLLEEWGVEPPLAAPFSVMDLIEAQVERTPGAPAVVGIDGQTLTYRELHERASRLARHLLGMGFGRGARVAFALDRSPDLVVSLLAILQAGAAYVPLDPAWPPERLAFMLEDAGAGLVLSHGELAARLPQAARVLDLERLDLAPESPLRPHAPISPDDLAYVLYTSGSTGRPKGVAMRHGVLAQMMAWQVAQTPQPLRTLQYTSPSFDVSFQEIVSTWAAGGALVLISEEARRDPAALLARLRAERVGRLFLPFVGLQQLAEAARGAALPESLREVITAGEQLRITPAIAAFFARLPGARLHNHYGPTETHVATAFVLEGDPAAWPALPSIGRPVAGARAVVADLDGQPAPVGAPGELLLGGTLPARGYLDRPDLTAARFVPDLFSGEPGARLYRTGDLARWQPDGTLELLGRIDAQVKIRGYRVEPGEVEAALAAHPAVAAVAVVPREMRPGDRRLVAWVVPAAGEEADPRALRSFVHGRLPDFMVPSVITSVASLPLTPGGKVDRRALARAPILPENFPDQAPAYVAPRTPAEDALARIWIEILGIERAGATDHFFDLGGHSLLAMQAVARVRTTLGVELPLRALFEAPVLADLAARIEQQAGRGSAVWKLPSAAAPAGGRVAPLSFGQQRLWFFDRLEPGASTFNMPVALRLAGRLRADLLARSFGEIVRRHDALRTTFAAGEDEEPYQIVHPSDHADPSKTWLPLVDLAALPAERARAEAERRGREVAGRPFDLERGPLWRSLLFRLAPEDHVCVTVLHHIVSDGWSLGILVREVGILYGAFSHGLPSPLSELPARYADYAFWQRTRLQGEKLDAQLRWWSRALDGAPQVLEIPGDRPRPPVLSRRGAELPLTLPGALLAGLRAAGAREGATLFMTLLAGYATVLGRWSGRDDLLIATPVAGRSRPELEGLIGFFVNDLTLRCDLTGDPPFRELVRRVRSMTLGAFAHQDLPSERLVEEILEERSRSRHPLTQVVFAFQNAPSGALALPGLALTPFPVDIGVAKVDLNLSLEEDSTGAISGVWEIATDLFEVATIERMTGHLLTLLAGAVEDPGRPLSELPLLTAAERAQLAAWNDTGPGAPEGHLLQERFLAWAERQPHAPAVIQGNRMLSYRELRTGAERLAGRLRALGVGPETRVVLCFDETIERVVAVVGTLLAGGAWVPLDPAWPHERLAWMLEDSAAPVVLTRRRLVGTLPAFSGRVVVLDELRLTDPTDLTDQTDHPSDPSDPSNPSDALDHLAYLIYTSGTTGAPNGVMIRHRSVACFIEQATRVLALGPGDRMLQVLSFSFDASVLETWAALSSGAALCVARREARLSGETLAEEMRLYGITHACLVPSLVAQLPSSRETDLPDLRRVIVGGESCPAELAHHWGPRLLNGYGPTETTILTSFYACTGRERREPPIGRPLAGTRLWVLDRALRPVPVGVPGALWIAGTGLARGYQNRPGLTAERFVPDPLSAEPGARLYRSGDLARVLPDGNLEFLGRLDRQVKIRGVRIELGEIETAIQAHPGVLESAVLVREGAGQEKSLVAFAVPRPGISPEIMPAVSELRAFLRGRLPETLVPAAIVLLEALPLTPVGKLDRKALIRAQARDDLAAAEASAQVPLRTPTEQALAEIWTELLGLSKVAGARASFFDLGGHSLLATRLASQIRRRWGIDLPLLAVFEAPVLEEMAARIDRELLRAGVPEAPPLVPTLVPTLVPIDPEVGRRHAPLSFAQRRLWFIEQLEPGSAAYHMVAALRLAGHLDVAALAGSFAAIVRRHETLRTTFEAVQGEPPRQVIADEGSFPLPIADLSALPAERRTAESGRLARAEAARPFDLVRGPLARGLLVRETPEEHVLAAVMHHIVSDGWSMGVLVRELGELYAASQEGRPAILPPLSIQYADFAAWQTGWLQGSVLESLLGWWRPELAGAPQVLDLPADRPRPPVPSRRGAEEWLILPAGLAAALRDLGQREGATPFMVLLAGLDVLLGRHAGQRDLLIGVPVANRTRAEVEPLIGFFVNTLVHRGRLDESPSFRDLLARVRASSLGMFEHQDLPFERLVEELGVERSRSRTPLVQVLFVLQNAPAGLLRLPGLTLEELPLTSGAARTDLVLSLTEHPETGAFAGSWEFSADLFDPATLRRLTRSFAVLLAGAAADPDAPIASLPLMPDEERHQVLVEWNRTATDWPRHASLGDLFVEQAARTPGGVRRQALIWTEGTRVCSMTWAELEERSARVARRLLALGVEPEERIGLLADRSPDLIAALLGILRAGGAYLPLDPSSPPERLAWMLEDASARRLLTDRRSIPGLPGLAVLRLEDAVAPGAPDLALPAVFPDALAYVMYTSGSTGTPKGVAVTHRNVVRLVRDTDYADLGPEQVWLQVAPVSFDASTLEIWAPLLNGGRLALLPPGPASLDDLARAIARLGVTSLWLTSGLFHQMAGNRLETLGSLRQLLAGGDALSPEHVLRVREGLPGLALINGYGPTEGTTFTTCQRLTGSVPVEASVPIGRPIANTRVYVLDDDLQPVPPGVVGELYAGGDGLARGYLGRPDLTAGCFVPDPFSDHPGRPGERLYRTGDRVRWRAGPAALELLGRRDGQVKIRGFRVETGEVEAVLARHPAVRQAVVMPREGRGGKTLAAWLTLHPAEPADRTDPSDLSAWLRERLPEPMIPTIWTVLDDLPLTPNGKIDRRALTVPEAPEAGSGEPRTPLERDLVEICAEVLGIPRVGIHDNFFDLGGHSLLATQLMVQLSERLHMEIPLHLIFDTRDLAELAEQIVAQQLEQVEDAEMAALVGEIQDLSPEEMRAMLSGRPAQGG